MDSLTKHDFTSPLLLFHRFLLALWAGSQNQRKRTCRVLVLELVPLVPSASKQWAEKLFLSSLDPLLLPLLSRFSRVTPETAAHQAPPVPGILQARTLEWDAIAFSDLLTPYPPAIVASSLASASLGPSWRPPGMVRHSSSASCLQAT